METIRKIDMHAHVSAYPTLTPKSRYNGETYPSAEQLIAMYDKLDIEYGVLLPINCPTSMLFTSTPESYKVIADEHPDRFVWFCNVDPRQMDNTPNADLSYLLMHYKNLGARGLGELTPNMYADDPFMDNLFHHLEECDMPVLFHISPFLGHQYGIVDDLHLPRLEKMIKKHPRLKFIGHSQPFWAEISADLKEEERNGYPQGKVTDGTLARLLRTYDNLYCDYSAGSGMNSMRRDPEYAAKFMEEFQDRLMWGCDICAPSNTHPFEFRDFMDGMRASGAISETVYYKIARGNAEKLLKL
ncbi:MAG: amidohydrolase family protein [Clostridia bacterium]|nr:amidohydrolase family protein [Clostridia bacterium]